MLLMGKCHLNSVTRLSFKSVPSNEHSVSNK